MVDFQLVPAVKLLSCSAIRNIAVVLNARSEVLIVEHDKFVWRQVFFVNDAFEDNESSVEFGNTDASIIKSEEIVCTPWHTENTYFLLEWLDHAWFWDGDWHPRFHARSENRAVEGGKV